MYLDYSSLFLLTINSILKILFVIYTLFFVFCYLFIRVSVHSYYKKNKNYWEFVKIIYLKVKIIIYMHLIILFKQIVISVSF